MEVMGYVGMGLMAIVSLSIPIVTLVFVILIFNKVTRIEKNLGGK